jgi:tRNA threonylcarbamoyl adenosine modification protein YeaZ
MILGIDTSGETCYIALIDQANDAVKCTQFNHNRQLIEQLPAYIDAFLSENYATLKDIECLVCGTGPGSFTGVRVGVMYAKTLAFALGKPVIGISSFDAAAYEDISINRAVVCTSKRNEVIAAVYPVYAKSPSIGPVDVATSAWDDWLTEHLPGTERIIGQGIEGANAPIGNLALGACLLAEPLLAKGNFSDIDSLIPLYVATSPGGGM